MKPRALRQAAIALLAFTGAMPAVHAQTLPDITACAEYAEADIVFAAAVVEAQADYEKFQNLTMEELGHLAPRRDKIAIIALRNDIHTARMDQNATYLHIYLDYGGTLRTEGDEPISRFEAMEKINHHRKLCTETYGHIPPVGCTPPSPPPYLPGGDPLPELCLCPCPIDE